MTPVESIAHLDPKQVNLKIIVHPRKKPLGITMIVKVSRFKWSKRVRRGRHNFYVIGLDAKSYDRVSISGQTELLCVSF